MRGRTNIPPKHNPPLMTDSETGWRTTCINELMLPVGTVRQTSKSDQYNYSKVTA